MVKYIFLLLGFFAGAVLCVEIKSNKQEKRGVINTVNYGNGFGSGYFGISHNQPRFFAYQPYVSSPIVPPSGIMGRTVVSNPEMPRFVPRLFPVQFHGQIPAIGIPFLSPVPFPVPFVRPLAVPVPHPVVIRVPAPYPVRVDFPAQTDEHVEKHPETESLQDEPDSETVPDDIDDYPDGDSHRGDSENAMVEPKGVQKYYGTVSALNSQIPRLDRLDGFAIGTAQRASMNYAQNGGRRTAVGRTDSATGATVSDRLVRIGNRVPAKKTQPVASAAGSSTRSPRINTGH